MSNKPIEIQIDNLTAEVARLQQALNQEKLNRQIERGHTPHCADRFVYRHVRWCGCDTAPTSVTEWAEVIHQYAKDKGWWDKERSFGDICTLFTCEVSEAYEAWRDGHGLTEVYYESEKPTKPEGIPIELADIIIRILDFCKWAGIDIQAIMAEKHRYNLTRAYRHGGKRA